MSLHLTSFNTFYFHCYTREYFLNFLCVFYLKKLLTIFLEQFQVNSKIEGKIEISYLLPAPTKVCFTLDCLDICFLIYTFQTYHGYFSVIYFQFNSIMIRDHCLHDSDFLKLVPWPRMQTIMLSIPCALKKDAFLYGWVDCSLNVSYLKLVNSIGQIFDILADFVSPYALLNQERSIEAPQYNRGFFNFSFKFYQFFVSCVLKPTH